MSTWIVFAVGFLAQLLFSGRILVQWIISEKAGRVITPLLFWQLSFFGSFLLFVYGYLRDDFAIMLGQLITYFIYIRNMYLLDYFQKIHYFLRYFFLGFPLLVALYFVSISEIDFAKLVSEEAIPRYLLILGIVSQVTFTLRFVYQWLYCERTGISHLPMGFWILSLTGSLLILIYAVFRIDPVLFLGHIFGSIAYVRNIMLSRQKEFVVK